MEFFGYLQRHIDAKRKHPGDDILSRMLSLEGDEACSNNEVLGQAFLFSLAGLDTVTGAIGFLFLHLARNPDLRRQMVADGALVGSMIEEVLRLEPPDPQTPRVTTQDIEVCGVKIPAGSPVMLYLATANRDAAKFQHPDNIDLAGDNRGHATFGSGIHRCLGSNLARRELLLVVVVVVVVVVEEFHKLIPDYEIAPRFKPEMVWPSSTWHLASLRLVVPPVAGSPS